MAVNYSLAIKNARLNAVVSGIGATGVIEIGTAGMALVLATIPLSNPAGTVSNGVLTFSGMPSSDTSADASGLAAAARIRTAPGGTDIITGLTVGLTGADVILDNTNLIIGQTITINSAVINHA